MMPVVETVWRHLLVNAGQGRRRWPSVSALAADLGVPVSTAHRSLEHPHEIGAVSTGALDGFQVLDPQRLLVLFAAHRRLQRDVVGRFTVTLSPEDVERRARERQVVIGGFGALVAHMGANWVAGYDTVIVYGRPGALELAPTPLGTTEVVVAEPDPLLRRYGLVTPFAQAYADVFCTPGWQAARFISDLDLRKVAARDEPVLLV